MATRNYIVGMSLKVSEHAWLRPHRNGWVKDVQDPDYKNAFNELSRRIFANNMVWDELYTNQKFTLYHHHHDEDGDFNFYRVEPLETNEAQILDLTGHPNAAGIFSTQRFLTRYWNTRINENRKRAAALLRITLCDSVMPSIERKTQDLNEKSKALGLSVSDFEKMHLPNNLKNRHTSDPACIKCHQRVDPIAWTFKGVDVSLSTTGIPGSLRYYISDKNLTDIPANNLSELVQVITQQPRYRWCQVNRFIKWTMGSDVQISETRRQQIENKFDALKRRPNDFIEYLLLTPEFIAGTNGIKKDDVSNAQVVFQKCNECHGGEMPIKDLPRMKEALDLKNNGKNREMPPYDWYWQPSKKDLQTIQRWIETQEATK